MPGVPISIENNNQQLALRFGAETEYHRQMARDIHDTVAAHVVSANLLLHQVKGRIKDDSACRSLEELDDQLANALRDLRAFCYLLDGPALLEQDWQCSVRELVTGFARRSQLEISLDIDLRDYTIAPPLQSVVTRIVQEALVNIVRHADASYVRIRVIADSSELALEIEDNGRGLPPDPAPGVGFGSMAARSREVNGECRVMTSAVGTTVVAHFPLGG